MEPDQDTAEERYLLQALFDLRCAFDRDAKPYLDRLIAIRSMQRHEPLVVTMDQWREFMKAKGE